VVLLFIIIIFFFTRRGYRTVFLLGLVWLVYVSTASSDQLYRVDGLFLQSIPSSSTRPSLLSPTRYSHYLQNPDRLSSAALTAVLEQHQPDTVVIFDDHPTLRQIGFEVDGVPVVRLDHPGLEALESGEASDQRVMKMMDDGTVLLVGSRRACEETAVHHMRTAGYGDLRIIMVAGVQYLDRKS
jgi:hypothetical protein